MFEQALALFVARGFAATTTREIAAQAGVTERTLFNLVASKSDLLREVLLALVFTEDFGPLLDRRDFQPVLRCQTVEDFLTAFARWVSNLHQATAAVAEMTRTAAGVDAGAAEIWARGNGQQVIDLRHLSSELRRRGWLRPGLSTADAGSSFSVLCGHETYWRLVVDQGWSPRRYRGWLRRHCAAELIA